MSRSERYISPSPAQLEQYRQSAERAERCDIERERRLRATLKKMKKADVIELALRIAKEEKASEWMLEREVGLDKSIELLVNDIEIAIKIATQFDELRMNYNPPINWDAYDAVQRGFLQLIQKERIEEAKRLALQLMHRGSYQIECSDEGLMLEEIENCLRPVIVAVAKSLAGGKWAHEMLLRDRVGFVCRQDLSKLAGALSPD